MRACAFAHGGRVHGVGVAPSYRRNIGNQGVHIHLNMGDSWSSVDFALNINKLVANMVLSTFESVRKPSAGPKDPGTPDYLRTCAPLDVETLRTKWGVKWTLCGTTPPKMYRPPIMYISQIRKFVHQPSAGPKDPGLSLIHI